MRVSDTSITAFGLVYQQVIAFLMGVVVARFLGASEYGTFSLVRNFTTMAITVLPLGLDIALLKYLPKIESRRSFVRAQFGGFRVVIIGVSILMVLLFCVAAPFIQSHLYKIDHFSIYLIIVALALPFTADMALFGAYAKAFGQVRNFVLVTMIGQTSLRAIVTAATLLSGGGIFGALLANTGASIITSVAVSTYYYWSGKTFRNGTAFDKKKSWLEIYATLQESIWMAMSVFVYALMRTADIFVLGLYSASAVVGSYSSLSFISFVIFVAPLALSQSLGPHVARCFKDHDLLKMRMIFNAYILKSCIASGFLLGGIAAFGIRLDLLLGNSFVVSPLLALLLPLGQFASAVFGPTGFALSMTGRHKLELYLLCAGASLLVALLFVLVPRYGPEGAAAASMLAYSITNVSRYVLVRQHLGIWLGHWSSAIPVFVALALGYLVQHFGRELFGVDLIGVGVACCVYTVVYGCFCLVFWRYCSGLALRAPQLRAGL